MPVNWKDPEAFTRLLAAMVAAQDMKLDYKKIATMYGNGATYDSIEGRFRIIKKEATALKAEIDNGDRPEPAARTPRRNKPTLSTPKKEKIIGGRVNKSAGTPSKKRGTVIKGIKEEPDSSFSDSTQIPSSQEDVEGELASSEVVKDSQFKFHYDDNDYVDEDMDIEAF